ncbi:MAG: 23S rRNA (pseudouridine(1915)-N(3))-methyltransferase RlmH [Shimia sp.]
MRIVLAAVGRPKGSPEAALCADYAARFAKVGRGLGLPPLEVVEVDDRRGGGPGPEAALLRRAIPRGAVVWALDERGRALSSPAFAEALAADRDAARDVCFVIGGASGLASDLRDDADRLLSLGLMVWPHALARAMLCEQIYRAATILAGTPYHKG